MLMATEMADSCFSFLWFSGGNTIQIDWIPGARLYRNTLLLVPTQIGKKKKITWQPFRPPTVLPNAELLYDYIERYISKL